MTNSTNLGVAILFMASLMLMGMAGLPFALFEATGPSPHLVAGLRLTFVGFLALAVGFVVNFRQPLKKEFSSTDVRDWLIFVGLSVVGVNGTLTCALFYLDDRMAMAVMFVAIGSVYILHHPTSAIAWSAAIFAISGTMLLSIYAPEHDKNAPVGFVLAAIGGTAQGWMFFKKKLMPRNIDPGIALGSAFLLGGLSMIAVAVTISDVAQPLIETPRLLIGTFASGLMTVLGWLILGYGGQKMTGAQKTGAASLEPVGAAFTQFFKVGVPGAGEVTGVMFLVASALVSILLNEERKHDNDRQMLSANDGQLLR